MSRGFKQAIGLLLLIALPILVYGAKEFPHWRYYQRLEQEGKWRAKIRVMELPVSQPGSDQNCVVEVHNIGSRDWQVGCLGVCQRFSNNGLGWRQTPPEVRIVDLSGNQFVANGDRYRLPETLKAGQKLELSFRLRFPDNFKETVLFFQMVKDDDPSVGWFGEEVRIEL